MQTRDGVRLWTTTAEAAVLGEPPALAEEFAEVSAEESAEAVLEASEEIPV